MRKDIKLFHIRTLFLLMVLGCLALATACSSKTKLSDRTLTLEVKRSGNKLDYVKHSIKKQPFYPYDSNAPLYKAVMYSKKGEKLGTFLFGKIFFMNKGSIHQLTFPYYSNLHRIVIYELDSSSGHITNKNKQVALNWMIQGGN